jgi:hypothetical protein
LYQSVWKRTDLQLQLSVSELSSNNLNAIDLKQNFPNPSISSTTISYEIPSSGIVNLSVYDLFGAEVACIFNGFQTAGTHSVELNTNHLNPGIYLYTINSNNMSASKRLTVIK